MIFSMIDYASFVPALREAVLSGGDIMAVAPSDDQIEFASDITSEGSQGDAEQEDQAEESGMGNLGE